jgi:hypothetical protein
MWISMRVISKSFGAKLPTPLWPSIQQWLWVCRYQFRSDVKNCQCDHFLTFG